MPEPFQPPGPPAAVSNADADAVVTEEEPGVEEDIVTLILDDHARIRHLFEALGRGERGPGPAALWAELAALLLTHLQAAEEICYLPFAKTRPTAGRSSATFSPIRTISVTRWPTHACAKRNRPSGGWRSAPHGPPRTGTWTASSHVCSREPVGSCRESRRALGRQWRQFTAASAATDTPG